MKSTFVLAIAESRLHADIMMIRLRRAGINVDRISAMFSRRFAPISFFCWLRRPRTLRSSLKDERGMVFAAGPLQKRIAGHDEVAAVPDLLQQLGLDRREAAHFSQALWNGHALLCVSVKNEDEAAIAWHIFKHSRAEDIAVTNHSLAERIAPPATPQLAAAAWPSAFAA